jgi:hypothetical protein
MRCTSRHARRALAAICRGLKPENLSRKISRIFRMDNLSCDTSIPLRWQKGSTIAACGARRMAETAAHLVDCVLPRVPMRQWVLSFPIPLRLLFASHPQLLSPVLRIVHGVIGTFLIQQAGLKGTEAATGAVTLIQRFGSAANLNKHA